MYLFIEIFIFAQLWDWSAISTWFLYIYKLQRAIVFLEYGISLQDDCEAYFALQDTYLTWN